MRYPFYVIDRSDLIINGVYHISARNGSVGIWKKHEYRNDHRYAFQIRREKFKQVFIDYEYHWDDNDEGCGTAKPIMFLEMLPSNLVVDVFNPDLGFSDDMILDYLYVKEKEIREKNNEERKRK